MFFAGYLQSNNNTSGPVHLQLKKGKPHTRDTGTSVPPTATLVHRGKLRNRPVPLSPSQKLLGPSGANETNPARGRQCNYARRRRTAGATHADRTRRTHSAGHSQSSAQGKLRELPWSGRGPNLKPALFLESKWTAYAPQVRHMCLGSLRPQAHEPSSLLNAIITNKINIAILTRGPRQMWFADRQGRRDKPVS